MTTLWFVRHGPTHEKAFTGWRDVPADLSDTARIARLHAFLPDEAMIISSDLRRAADTATAIETGRKRLRSSPKLREFDFGVWDGMKFDEVASRDPVLSRQFWEQPGHISPPDGESWYDVSFRVSEETDRLTQTHAGKNIVVVAHIGVILTQIARATGHTPAQALSHTVDNLSVTRINVQGDGWKVKEVNVCP